MYISLVYITCLLSSISLGLTHRWSIELTWQYDTKYNKVKISITISNKDRYNFYLKKEQCVYTINIFINRCLQNSHKCTYIFAMLYRFC